MNRSGLSCALLDNTDHVIKIKWRFSMLLIRGEAEMKSAFWGVKKALLLLRMPVKAKIELQDLWNGAMTLNSMFISWGRWTEFSPSQFSPSLHKNGLPQGSFYCYWLQRTTEMSSCQWNFCSVTFIVRLDTIWVLPCAIFSINDYILVWACIHTAVYFNNLFKLQ